MATKATSEIEDSDADVRIATKYSEQKDDGNPMYTNNAFYGNHLTAEAVSETEAYIYQYYPNGYIAKYSFTVGTDTGVEKTETPKATLSVVPEKLQLKVNLLLSKSIP